MEFKTYSKNDVTVLQVIGYVLHPESLGLKDKLHELVDGGCRRILVDLGAVELIDSSGLGGLLEIYRRLKAEQGVLKLCAANKKLRQIFDLTGLINFLECYPSVSEALKNFS